MRSVIPTRIVPSVRPSDLTPGQVERKFRGLIAHGASIRPAGSAQRRPALLLSAGYTPKYKLELFDTTFYLTNVRQNPDIRFFVVYVRQEHDDGGRALRPRIFYKDVSLIWRSASHWIRSAEENWIGKGDLKTIVEDGEEITYSAEETTDLPLELQGALESLSRRIRKIRRDDRAIGLVLRRGGDARLAPYPDFTAPRRRAQSDRRNLVHGGRSIARFTRKNDPTSLRFAAGFEPDFGKGLLEIDEMRSRLYGGRVRRYRILSRNRKIQYLFMAGARHVWIIPPQATTTELSSYGVRTIDVVVDEDLCVPGYEYHFVDGSEDPPELVTQIPEGFAGEPSASDPERADASAWLDRLPVVQEFRKKILAKGFRVGFTASPWRT